MKKAKLKRLNALLTKLNVSAYTLATYSARAGYDLTSTTFYNVLAGKYEPTNETLQAVRAGFEGAAEELYPEMTEEISMFFNEEVG